MKRHNKNSIWNRLKYSFILILIVPVLALGSYMVYSSIAFVKNERNMEAKQMMETNILDLNNRLAKHFPQKLHKHSLKQVIFLDHFLFAY